MDMNMVRISPIISPAAFGKPNHFKILIFSTFSCLGVIWGDIGTSPLYALNEIFIGISRPLNDSDVLGVLSLILWSLILVVTVKYILIVLSCDYCGEGGIFALFQVANCRIKDSTKLKHVLLVFSVLGASALVADGLITPALSVLSAVEGLQLSKSVWNVLISLGILISLYASQRFGSSKVGRVFGPICFLYFSAIGGVGLYNLVSQGSWTVLKAFNPGYGIKFLFTSGLTGFKSLAGIVLALTGSEAVSADLGHFSKPPVYLSWFLVVFPCLILSYAGQCAYTVARLGHADGTLNNPFFASIPKPIFYPVWILSMLATIIASQAMITGCFSLINQAVALDLFPRIKTYNTDPRRKAQIYIPSVTACLCLGTCALVIFFKTSNSLAGAYGISVILGFLVTDILLIWAWKVPKIVSVPVSSIFMLIDLSFLSANVYEKIEFGGYLPLLIGAVIMTCMLSWKYGSDALIALSIKDALVLEDAMEIVTIDEEEKNTPGIGVFVSSNEEETVPESFRMFKKMNGNRIFEKTVFLNVSFDKENAFVLNNRVQYEVIDKHITRMRLNYGFAEPLSEISLKDLIVQDETVWYFVHAEHIKPKKSRSLLKKLPILVYSFLLSISADAAEFYGIPQKNLVVLGDLVFI
jgi:KUP system potassium uptake protein